MKIKMAIAAFLVGALSLSATAQTVPVITASAATDTFKSDWQSINRGGGLAQSKSYRLPLSIGQSLTGADSSAGYRLGIGFWYGLCDCGVWGDANCDRLINPVDVVVIVNYVYKSNDQRCPLPRCLLVVGDVNCSGAVNPVDVVLYVNLVYKANRSGWCLNPCRP